MTSTLVLIRASRQLWYVKPGTKTGEWLRESHTSKVFCCLAALETKVGPLIGCFREGAVDLETFLARP